MCWLLSYPNLALSCLDPSYAELYTLSGTVIDMTMNLFFILIRSSTFYSKIRNNTKVEFDEFKAIFNRFLQLANSQFSHAQCFND